MFRAWEDDVKSLEAYLRNLPAGGTATTKAKIPEMVPLKIRVSQKLQEMLPAIVKYLKEHIHFGTPPGQEAIRVPEGS